MIVIFSLVATLAAACDLGGEENEGGEAPLVGYTDTADGIVLKYPSTWTRTGELPPTFSGQDESLTVEVRSFSAMDVLAAARQDEPLLQSFMPDYKLLKTASSKAVKNAAVISYEWTLPGSAITGKPVPQRADRYYIDLGNGRLAILTSSSPKSRFDAEQVRDMALGVRAVP